MRQAQEVIARPGRGWIALAALALSVCLAACGGGQESGASSNSSEQTAAEEDGSSAGAIAPLRVRGGGSAQFEVKGGDNSVQEYGSEAGKAELRDAAEAVHGFLAARGSGEWAHACALLTQGQIDTLAKQAGRAEACPATLAAITKPVSSSLARAITTVDVVSLRADGDRAFLIYVGLPERTVYAMPLVRESDTWKLGAISSSVLPVT